MSSTANLAYNLQLVINLIILAFWCLLIACFIDYLSKVESYKVSKWDLPRLLLVVVATILVTVLFKLEGGL